MQPYRPLRPEPGRRPKQSLTAETEDIRLRLEAKIRQRPEWVAQLSVSGARDVEEFVRVLREQAPIASDAASDTEPDTASDGAAMCGDGFCEVRK